MRRGDVYWVDFEPAQDGEIRKTRPAVIVSNDAAIRVQNRVQVVPLTSAASAPIRPWHAAVRVGGITGRALADQIRTVAKDLLGNQEGSLTRVEMLAVEQAIRVQLGMP